MKVFVARVTTDFLDDLTFVYLNKPPKEDVIKRFMKEEGIDQDSLAWHIYNSDVTIKQAVVIGTEEE